MLFYELQCLGVDDRLEDLFHRVPDYRSHPVALPAAGEGEHVVADAGQLLFVGSQVHVDQLGVQGTQDRSAGDEAFAVERPSEGHHRRFGDDRLVEIEERRLHGKRA